MILDLPHELSVLSAFFARQVTWITTEGAKLASAQGADTRTDEEIENELFHSDGPGSVQELVCRMTVNELNSLVETSLQQALIRVSGTQFVHRGKEKYPTTELVYALPRTDLEKRLSETGLRLRDLPGFLATQEIKEISEGIKHRERLRPVPGWENSSKGLVNRESIVTGATGEAISFYDLTPAQVSSYLAEASSFISSVERAQPTGAA